MKVFLVIFSLCALFLKLDAFKVLGVLPFQSKSHFAIGNSILKTLHKAGHEITSLTPFPQKKEVKNFVDIDISFEIPEEEELNAFTFANMPVAVLMAWLPFMGKDLVELFFQNSNVQNLMSSGEKFDVCVVEIFGTESLMGLADHFDCVLITFTTFGAVKWINEMSGGQTSASYVPNPFLHFTEKMTFFERLQNTAFTLLEDIVYSQVNLRLQRNLYNKHFPNARKSFDETFKNSALILVNDHVSSSSARPYVPSVIEICGLHVEPAKPLPKDIQDFMDSAKDGAILFSMGSTVQSKDWAEDKREAFVKAFGKLKQKVIWKYENETLPNKPDNVMISSWLPQRDIVAHPNVKLFITHGGLLGTTEALIEGVPVLGIPIFGDQRMNMAKAVAREYGLMLTLNEITEEKLSADFSDLLTNPKYKKNAEVISSHFNDRPMTPQEAVLYWTEYAVRHNGAKHLKPQAIYLNFVQLHLIDVYLALTLIGSIILYLNYVLLKFTLKKLFGKKSGKKLKKK